MGMTMGEIFQVKELADDCAADGVYEFLFVAPAIPITGAVGSPVNPLAIKLEPSRLASRPSGPRPREPGPIFPRSRTHGSRLSLRSAGMTLEDKCQCSDTTEK
jgi:hypothetical protein